MNRTSAVGKSSPHNSRRIIPICLFVFICWSDFNPCLNAFELFRARMAVDYGPRLIGLAISIGMEARPLTTIPNTGNLSYISRDILRLAKGHGVSELLIGLPLDSHGRLGQPIRNFNGKMCQNFSQVIAAVAQNEFPRTNVYICDERYTTKEAKMRMKMERIKASLDAMSACCLLQRYIDDRGEDVILASPALYPIPKQIEMFDYNLVRQYIRDMYEEEAVELSPKALGQLRIQRLKSASGAQDMRRGRFFKSKG